MNNTNFQIITLSTLLAFGTVCEADISKRIRAGLAYTDYDLEYSSGSGGSISAVNYMSIQLGMSVINGPVFFDIAYSTSLNAEHSFTLDGQDNDFDRYDFALAGGYLLGNHWSVFGGYKFGESEYSNYALAGAPDTTLTFETEGFFGGVSKTFPMGENALTLNASVAFMDGKLFDNDTGGTPLNADGDALGLSIGAGYSVPLKQNMGLEGRLSYQSYEFTDLTDPFWGELRDFNENILSIGATLFMNF
jgi:hypothetical protein